MRKASNVKALLVGVMSLTLVVALCACGNTDSVSSDGDIAPESVATTPLTSTQAQISSESTHAPSTSNTTRQTPTANKLNTTAAPKNSTTPSTSSKTTTTTSRTTAAQKTPAQIIIGKWRGSMDIGPMLSEQGINVDGEQIVSCDVEYTTGEVVYEVVDRNSLKTVFTTIFAKALDDSLAQNNLTKEQFEANAGVTYDAYLAQTVQTAMDLIPHTIISAYKFQGKDLYIREQGDADFEKVTYSFNGENKMTIVEDGVSITYTRIR